MNITEYMKKSMNVENCDVLNENGVLSLVYDLDGFLNPLTLVHAHSYHELNEKAMRIFEPKDWMRFLIDESVNMSISTFHPLVADMFKNHHDVYEAVVCDVCADEAMEDDVDRLLEEEEEDKPYLTLVLNGEKDENGHRMANLKFEDLEKLDYDKLRELAKDLGIENVDNYGPTYLSYAISMIDLDADDIGCDYSCDKCECGEKIGEDKYICHYDDCDCEDEDTEDECDGDCENCECADIDDRDEEDDEDDRCTREEDERPDWPHPIKEDAKAEAADTTAQPYEYVNGPAHYHGTECIENMRKLFGDEAVRWFCILSAYKYRFRDGSKPGVSAEQDEQKAHWYEDYAVKMQSEQHYY